MLRHDSRLEVVQVGLVLLASHGDLLVRHESLLQVGESLGVSVQVSGARSIFYPGSRELIDGTAVQGDAASDSILAQDLRLLELPRSPAVGVF